MVPEKLRKPPFSLQGYPPRPTDRKRTPTQIDTTPTASNVEQAGVTTQAIAAPAPAPVPAFAPVAAQPMTVPPVSSLPVHPGTYSHMPFGAPGPFPYHYPMLPSYPPYFPPTAYPPHHIDMWYQERPEPANHRMRHHHVEGAQGRKTALPMKIQEWLEMCESHPARGRVDDFPYTSIAKKLHDLGYRTNFDLIGKSPLALQEQCGLSPGDAERLIRLATEDRDSS